MAMEYFCFYHSYARKLARLSDQEVGRLVRALLDYSENGEQQELTGREALAFDFIADEIDRAKEKYEERCRKNRANASERNRSQANASETSESKSKSKSKSNTTPTPPNADGIRAVLAVWEENIGEVPRVVIQEAASYLSAGIDVEVVCEAIKSAVKNDAPRWSYIDAILKRCVKEGCWTLDDWKKGERKHEAAQHGGGAGDIDWGEFGTSS